MKVVKEHTSLLTGVSCDRPRVRGTYHESLHGYLAKICQHQKFGFLCPFISCRPNEARLGGFILCFNAKSVESIIL